LSVTQNVAAGNIAAANAVLTNNLAAGNLSVSGLSNSTCANITTLWVQDLTVQNAIAAPATTTGSEYRLRVSQGSRQDGYFGVGLGTTANGNAWLRFDTSAGNVWRATANSTEGTYYTIITRQNVSDDVATTDSSNVASLTAVKIANANALAALAAANSGANSVWVYAYGGSVLSKANLNFINTASVNAFADANGSTQANVSFAMNTANIVAIGTGAAALTISPNTTISQNLTVSGNLTVTGNITGTLKSTKDSLTTATVSGATTVNLNNGNWFRYTLTGTPTFTFANAPASGNAMTVTLLVLQNGTGGYTPAWGNTIYWAGGQVPPASTGANKLDMWTFTTTDGGSTFIGTLAVKDAR
jgi:hypothetical protein